MVGLGDPGPLQRTDPGGITSTYTYDSANTNADFDYDMLSETPPGASAQTVNLYNSNGEISQQTDPAGGVTTYTYAGTNSSESGGTTTITSYPDGTGTGEPTDVTVDTYSSNALVQETTGYGTSSAVTTTIYRDEASYMPIAVTDGDDNTTSYTYETYSSGGTTVSSANVLTSTDALGNTTQHVYTAANQVWCTVGPADYANGKRCPSTEPTSPPAEGASDPNLGMTIAFYNSADQVTATTDALGNTTTYSFTSGVSGVPNNLLYCEVDPADYQRSVTCPAYGATHVSGTTTSTYDSAGDEMSSTNADGDTTTYAYADASTLPGTVTSVTDPDGTVTPTPTTGPPSRRRRRQASARTPRARPTPTTPKGASTARSTPSRPLTSRPTSPPVPLRRRRMSLRPSTDADGRVIQVTNPLGAPPSPPTTAPASSTAPLVRPTTPWGPDAPVRSPPRPDVALTPTAVPPSTTTTPRDTRPRSRTPWAPSISPVSIPQEPHPDHGRVQ